MKILIFVLIGALAGASLVSVPAQSAEKQIQFAACKVALREDGFKKVVGTSNLTTTKTWYKANGYQQTLKATLRQKLHPILNSKFGKGNYRVTCSKTM